jgi:hypothetical protein
MAAYGSPTAPNCPGGGGSTLAQNNISVAGEAHAKWDGVGASFKAESLAKSQAQCPTNNVSVIIQKNKAQNLMTIDNSMMIMNKNSLTSMTESVNQMIVNSITNTTSSSSQNVNVQQQINIKISGVKGNVTIDNLKQEASIDLSNAVNMELSAINNVRTDLASQVLDSFKSNTNADTMSQASADIATQIENQTSQSVVAHNTVEVDQTAQSDNLPVSTPTDILPADPSSNINQRQEVENDLVTSVIHNSPFSLTNDVSRVLENTIKNSVTQNFTHNTVTQLMQTINLSQQMNIDVSAVGGDVMIKNLSQVANVQLRQVLSAKMNIGSSIVNSVKNASGIQTDDEIGVKKHDTTGLSSKTGLRNASSYSSDVTTDSSYTQKMTTGCGGLGALAPILSILVCCCICSSVAPMLGSMLPQPGASVGTTEDSEASTESESPASPASPEAPADASSSESSEKTTGTAVG